MTQSDLQEYLVYFWQLVSGWRMKHEQHYSTLRQRDCAPHLNSSKPPLQILDLANGHLRPQANLLAVQGHQVFGIDLINWPKTSSTVNSYRLARWLFRLRSPHQETSYHPSLTCGNVGALPFADNSFDLVTSIAAFEHFLDVSRVIAEVYRVLRPRGLAWICIHPFTCISGGHNITRTQIPLRTLPKRVAAWDHLRERDLPFDVPLNEWRIPEYQTAFKAQFTIIRQYCAIREGEHILTPALKEELAAYSLEELTCHAYIILAQKDE